jgi:hypothetical protein
MEILSEVREHPDVSAEQRTSGELLKLARKLRWIGMDKEADQMQSTLRMVEFAGGVLSAHRETD